MAREPEYLGARNAPIGVFDSGVGGLSVWNPLVCAAPHESTCYLADQAHAPYGARAAADIEQLTHAAAEKLFAIGVKALVIACNTASAAALTSLRARWPQAPIIGMEPAVKPASERTRTGRVGVMATPGTLRADRFSNLVERFASGVEVITQVCPGLVEMVESGQLDGPVVENRLHEFLDPLLAANIDYLVLGCTHYPFLSAAIQRVVGLDVTLIDPAPAVARQTISVLATRNLLAPAEASPQYRFYTTADPAPFRLAISRLASLSQADVHTLALPIP